MAHGMVQRLKYFLGLVDLCIPYGIVAYYTNVILLRILSEVSPQQQHISCIPNLQIRNISILYLLFNLKRNITTRKTLRVLRRVIRLRR
jgi:hypothetical protein